MKHNARSIRPFIGAKNFETSRRFYRDLGFEENAIAQDFSVFHSGAFSFYLQAYYVKEWVDNTMVFMEVDDTQRFYNELMALKLEDKYDAVRIVPIRTMDWGKECFVHDPSGVLWHFGEFFN
ncbi:glyoxalase [Flavobacterium sp.]|uniref:glyoxalase n=1 Tax=Flavobacterium sp. TaxID=239 RepID=UPI004033BA78